MLEMRVAKGSSESNEQAYCWMTGKRQCWWIAHGDSNARHRYDYISLHCYNGYTSRKNMTFIPLARSRVWCSLLVCIDDMDLMGVYLSSIEDKSCNQLHITKKPLRKNSNILSWFGLEDFLVFHECETNTSSPALRGPFTWKAGKYSRTYEYWTSLLRNQNIIAVFWARVLGLPAVCTASTPFHA